MSDPGGYNYSDRPVQFRAFDLTLSMAVCSRPSPFWTRGRSKRRHRRQHELKRKMLKTPNKTTCSRIGDGCYVRKTLTALPYTVLHIALHFPFLTGPSDDTGAFQFGHSKGSKWKTCVFVPWLMTRVENHFNKRLVLSNVPDDSRTMSELASQQAGRGVHPSDPVGMVRSGCAERDKYWQCSRCRIGRWKAIASWMAACNPILL